MALHVCTVSNWRKKPNVGGPVAHCEQAFRHFQPITSNGNKTKDLEVIIFYLFSLLLKCAGDMPAQERHVSIMDVSVLINSQKVKATQEPRVALS